MPVILKPDDYDLWLDPAFRDLSGVSAMLKPFDPAPMRRYPVSTRVNNVQNDDADCAKPFDVMRHQPSHNCFERPTGPVKQGANY